MAGVHNIGSMLRRVFAPVPSEHVHEKLMEAAAHKRHAANCLYLAAETFRSAANPPRHVHDDVMQATNQAARGDF